MLYRCDSCGAYMVYDPDVRALVCPQCGRLDEEMPSAGGISMKAECPNCGAGFENAERRLVYQCPYCSSWISVDANLSAADAPKKITPFSFGRKQAREKIRDAFDQIPFLPDSFLKDPEGTDIEALYAPFWRYRFTGRGDYHYTGEKQSVHRNGRTTITDHRVYEIHRAVEAEFSNVPVDAMDSLDDETIDAALPFDPELAEDMNPVYLAGTDAWLPDRDASEPEYLDRAQNWALETMKDRESSLALGYVTLRSTSVNRSARPDPSQCEGVLLPVYRYEYKGFGTHRIYMNGTTGRMSGNAPCDSRKVVIHYLVEAACTLICAAAIVGIMGVMLI